MNSRDSRSKKVVVELERPLGKSAWVRQQLFETTLRPDGSEVFHRDVSVHAEGKVNEAKLKEIAEEVQLTHAVVPETHRIHEVYLRVDSEKNKRSFARFSISVGGLGKATLGEESPRVIFGVTQALERGNMHRYAAFHEASHSVFEAHEKTDAGSRVRVAYERLMKKCGFPIRPAWACSAIPPDFEEHPLLSLFDESRYIPGSDMAYGHHGQNESEFFASGAAVMRHFPKQFLNRLRALSESDARGHQLAVHAATRIAALFKVRAKKVFGNELIDYLKTTAKK